MSDVPTLVAFFLAWTALAVAVGIAVGKRLRGSNGKDAQDRKSKSRRTA